MIYQNAAAILASAPVAPVATAAAVAIESDVETDTEAGEFSFSDNDDLPDLQIEDDLYNEGKKIKLGCYFWWNTLRVY